ncbi:MAG: helix-turn-helix transcriptional regulator [Gammaproteobacteria bacterium]
MAKNSQRAYSAYTRNALALFASMIRVARIEHKLTTQELAERAGISRGLLQRIEKGDPACSIGVVFELATLVGVKLFNEDEQSISYQLHQAEEKLALLPKHMSKRTKAVDDDF